MTATMPNDGRVVERLRRLVEIETPTGDADALTRAHALLRSWIEPVVGQPAEVETVDGVPHLRWTGGTRPRCLLLAHLDTVWPAGTVASRPFRLDGDRATGPGVFDMKAGLVIIAEALARVSDPASVAVLVTGDEETGSLTSRGIVEREAIRAGAVLVLEPSLDGAVKIARRGGGIYRIDVEGRSAHAGLEPELGRNALLEAARQALALPDLADEMVGTTVSPTVARAGSATNVIPDHAELRVDVRAWTLAELERVDAAMARLSASGDGLTVQVAGGINRPPMEDIQARPLLALAERVAVERGLTPVESAAVGGASDGNFTAAVGVLTLDGLGPDGGGAHAVHEWISVSSMLERIELISGMLDALPGDAQS